MVNKNINNITKYAITIPKLIFMLKRFYNLNEVLKLLKSDSFVLALRLELKKSPKIPISNRTLFYFDYFSGISALYISAFHHTS